MFFLSELGEAKCAVIFLINEKMVADKWFYMYVHDCELRRYFAFLISTVFWPQKLFLKSWQKQTHAVLWLHYRSE